MNDKVHGLVGSGGSRDRCNACHNDICRDRGRGGGTRGQPGVGDAVIGTGRGDIWKVLGVQCGPGRDGCNYRAAGSHATNFHVIHSRAAAHRGSRCVGRAA